MSLSEPPQAAATSRRDESAGPKRADVVTDAVRLGLSQKTRRSMSRRTAIAEAGDLLRQARNDKAYGASLPRVLQLIQEYPEAEDLQFTAARLIMESGDTQNALSAWVGIHARFPAAPEPFRMIVRMTARTQGQDVARAIVAERFPDASVVSSEHALFALALGLEEIGEAAQAEDTLCRLTRNYPRARTPWRHLIRLQEARGGLMSAQNSASMAASACGDDEFTQAYVRITREIGVLETLDPNASLDDGPYSVKALNAIIANFVNARRSKTFPIRRHLGGVLLLGGSLGSGGAERQLVTTALSLHEASQAGRLIDGADVVGPISVACRSLSSKNGNDFFLKSLTGSGIQVTDYSRLAPYGGQIAHSRVKTISEVVSYLPNRIREGIVHLVDFFRHESPDVVHIWQDGMVFAAGLAALIADVPRIVLSVRTLPPTDRVNRWKLELEPIYKALLRSPGVVLMANSTMAARRYEEWLGLKRGAAPVVHNGVSRLSETPAPEDELLWRAFSNRTADAEFTVGAVMRLDNNKRPLDWLSVAESLHRRSARTRFIIVGDGALRHEAQEYAHRLGIADRVLFTGVSGSVGYWLSRMDVLMLLSRFEGMPNVLIEAQLAGKPVVTTPAGGAPETVRAGITGWITKSAETIDIGEVTQILVDLMVLPPPRRRAIEIAARSWAEEAFSVELMLARTVQVFMSPYMEPMISND